MCWRRGFETVNPHPPSAIDDDSDAGADDDLIKYHALSTRRLADSIIDRVEESEITSIDMSDVDFVTHAFVDQLVIRLQGVDHHVELLGVDDDVSDMFGTVDAPSDLFADDGTIDADDSDSDESVRTGGE